MLLSRRPKVADVAARAGVSPATVDRVINGRGGVQPKTVALVEAAIRELVDGQRTGRLAGGGVGGRRFDVVLAGDGTHLTRALGEALVAAGAAVPAQVEVAFVELMNPVAQAERLRACIARGSAGVAVQVLDHVLVRAALEELAAADIPVVTVLTDIAGVDRLAYAGLDNRAAGRTAGLLMARFCRQPGPLAIVWGGQLYRSHEERESGFRSVLRAERGDLRCLEVITGNDNPAVTRARVTEAIRQHRDLVGLYCVGGGVVGAAEAIEQAGLAPQLVMIGHNCNAETKPHILSGTIHAVIHQDVARIAETTVRCLATRTPPPPGGIPVEIVTRENAMDR